MVAEAGVETGDLRIMVQRVRTNSVGNLSNWNNALGARCRHTAYPLTNRDMSSWEFKGFRMARLMATMRDRDTALGEPAADAPGWTT